MTLQQLAVDHPYYCSENNYFASDAGQTWETMTDFLAEFRDADVDMNLVFRWDVHSRDEEHPEFGRYYADVFMMHQRKGIFSPHHIKHINEVEAEAFSAYLRAHWAKIHELWQPLAGETNQEPDKT